MRRRLGRRPRRSARRRPRTGPRPVPVRAHDHPAGRRPDVLAARLRVAVRDDRAGRRVVGAAPRHRVPSRAAPHHRRARTPRRVGCGDRHRHVGRRAARLPSVKIHTWGP
ncbi:hypothetical protein D0T12_23475 [Actinomadura spongiicola]|uniref:Uncharacterized protein n=1 Tax=Actinomadura spongiicola TaxID=2303421 RepID=A0A372GCR3_9ACTN|nr:hypothetical protein D0T12_23475 [Actinomadura spongiicola]